MFDYIVVGAGSAGCVLASRLSEDPAVSVLLIEAGGPDRKQEIHIPAAFSKLFKGPCDWAYETEPEPHLNNRRLYWPRGKVLGGSSSINAMICTVCARDDYDQWRAGGNEGWGYDDVAPYFARALGGHSEEAATGPDGPLGVARLRHINPLSRAFVAAGVERGLARRDGFKGAYTDGVGLFGVTQRDGKRLSSAAAYLKPARGRPNLTVRTGTHVARVLFEGTRAAGVTTLARGRQQEEVRARREVLLCGGAVNSPQVLLLSGIGPAADLRALGIEVVRDLPGVGGNLQDHAVAGVATACTQPVSLASAESIGNILRYLIRKQGPLTSNVAEAGAFIRTRADLAAPDLELIFGPVYFINHGFTKPDGHGFSIGAILLHPASRGRISLRSADPLAPPAIRANYLAEPQDLALLVEGVKRCRDLANATAFAPYRGDEYLPGAQVRSDEEVAAFVRANLETLYHPVGTCAMGIDGQAVVDPRLRVHGVEGLRVVDASVMPTIVSGHTNVPTIMIAEKAADMIKADAKAGVRGESARVPEPVPVP